MSQLLNCFENEIYFWFLSSPHGGYVFNNILGRGPRLHETANRVPGTQTRLRTPVESCLEPAVIRKQAA